MSQVEPAPPPPAEEAEGGDGDGEKCPICFDDLSGAAGPDSTDPSGEWGYTNCCGATYHFDCMGRALNPVVRGAVESSRGMVEQELTCPTCRSAKIARTAKRMLAVEKPVRRM